MKLLDAMKAVELFRSWPPDVQEACFELIGDPEFIGVAKKFASSEKRRRNPAWSKQEINIVGDMVASMGPTPEAFSKAAQVLGSRTADGCRWAYRRYILKDYR